MGGRSIRSGQGRSCQGKRSMNSLIWSDGMGWKGWAEREEGEGEKEGKTESVRKQGEKNH